MLYAESNGARTVLHMTTLRDWLLELPARGQYTFTTADARNRQPDVSPAATMIALRRAADAGLIVTPVRGFHVVLPLEDRLAGSPSWRLFLDPLLRFLGLPYYVGLLTAAAHHGASAQAAQVVQVVVPRQRRPVAVGQVRIEFIVNRAAAQAPVRLINTPGGRLRMATPELTALDVVRFPARSGGWGNVLTVLRDLAPGLRAAGVADALETQPAAADVQRLGYLLEQVGGQHATRPLRRWLDPRPVSWTPLVPGAGRVGERDERWRVIVNERIEAD